MGQAARAALKDPERPLRVLFRTAGLGRMRGSRHLTGACLASNLAARRRRLQALPCALLLAQRRPGQPARAEWGPWPAWSLTQALLEEEGATPDSVALLKPPGHWEGQSVS